MNMAGRIACYVRNRNNMNFAWARNQAYDLSTGDFIAITDNDIEYKEGWLDECVMFLEMNEGKYLCSPLHHDPANAKPSRWDGEVDGWKLNYRAGSNCFMVRADDYDEIGGWDYQHNKPGSEFCDRFGRLGYRVAMMPEAKAVDLGLRKGFDFKQARIPTAL